MPRPSYFLFTVMIKEEFEWIRRGASRWSWNSNLMRTFVALVAVARESKIAQRKCRLVRKMKAKKEIRGKLGKANKKAIHKDKNLSKRKWRHEWMSSWTKCMFDWMSVQWISENAQEQHLWGRLKHTYTCKNTHTHSQIWVRVYMCRLAYIFPNHIYIFMFTCWCWCSKLVKRCQENYVKNNRNETKCCKKLKQTKKGKHKRNERKNA